MGVGADRKNTNNVSLNDKFQRLTKFYQNMKKINELQIAGIPELSDTQNNILKTLKYYGPQSIISITERLDVSASAISQNTDFLVGIKLVNRIDNPRNRRKVIISITTDGIDVINKIINLSESEVIKFLNLNSRSDLDRCHMLLDELINRRSESW